MKRRQFPFVPEPKEMDILRERERLFRISIAAQIRAAIRAYNEENPLPPAGKNRDIPDDLLGIW